jgi:2-(1,2-epoxy-1,2-dihydrophenyl)acetyl-CoA isomerase
MPSDTILIERDGGVATVVLNRPERMNALSADLLSVLPARLRELEADRSVRCIVLTGSGERAFSAGGDVKDMDARGGPGAVAGHAPAEPEPLEAAMDRLTRSQEASWLVHTMGKPTLAALNGVAAGAALSMALACDLRIAADDVELLTAFSNIGFSGDFGGSFFMTQIVGTAKARELYFLSEKIKAETAQALGLVNWVVPREKFRAETQALAQRLAAGPPLAYRYMKRNLNMALHADADTMLRLEAEAMIRTGDTEDFKNAVKAFLAKKSPVFKGR